MDTQDKHNQQIMQTEHEGGPETNEKGLAEAANAQEHQLTIWNSVKLYPKAIGWSTLLSTAIIMEGYDTKLIGSLQTSLGNSLLQKFFGASRHEQTSGHTGYLLLSNGSGLSHWRSAPSSAQNRRGGTDLRRTLTACAVWGMQILSGTGLRIYSTYFYEQAGLAATQSFNMSPIQYALAVIGVWIAWVMLPRFGRWTLYLMGQAA
ncbi:hypothetical protein DV736_g5918, partial [Chaetothyriales sp. CBS 134916]